MVRIYVIDNGGQWTHREWRTLRDLGVETRILPNTTPFNIIEKERVDGLILSGGAPRMGLQSELGNCGEYLEKSSFPILGICAGHQYIARFFGGEVKPSKIPEFGKIELEILESDDEIFKDIPRRIIAWESHNDEVTKMPSNFIHLAKSENCLIQAMKHRDKAIYGLQFHPEVEHTEYGEKIFENFIEICRQY
ncbi:MAG: GMP synthase subunit A [Thermoplasmata archaeon]|nr:MAG: GMP synthase subunit A [Thermoplasmata archaeon]HEC89079.1 GMP synthase subunit A [Thermoplasmatales archaeon]